MFKFKRNWVSTFRINFEIDLTKVNTTILIFLSENAKKVSEHLISYQLDKSNSKVVVQCQRI